MEESGISEDHPLHSLVKSLSKRLLDARGDSTVKKYYSFMKWETIAKGHSLISLPASPIHVSLYLVLLFDSGATYSTVSSDFYSIIKWAHDMCGQLDCHITIFTGVAFPPTVALPAPFIYIRMCCQ